MVLDDTLLTSFLLDEQRPEKGLKELALLFGLTDYGRLKVTAKEGRATCPSDPDLLYYNCMDSATTLRLYHFTLEMIAKTYGAKTAKLTRASKDMRNVVLWDTILMELAGIVLDSDELMRIHEVHEDACAAHIARAADDGLIIAGEGSEKSCRQFMTDALIETGLIHDSRVQLTEKEKKISVGKENFNLLSTEMDEGYPSWEKFLSLKAYHVDSKILTSYTRPLLHQPRKGIVHDTTVYPQWYPMPSVAAKYSGGDEGGTLQGRVTCKNPGCQTWPPTIKKCITSRFKDGKILAYDLSQIELRGAAILSGDPVMQREYNTPGTDRHHNQAARIWKGLRRNRGNPAYEQKRQAGKTLNFLVLYKGGAKKYKETLMCDVGLDLPLQECEDAMRSFDAAYSVFRAWQEMNEEKVRRNGYLEVPTGWSRQWGKGKPTGHFINEIADFPIQTIAAQMMQWSQFEIHKSLLRQGLRAVIILNIYDSIYIDCPPDEEEKVDKIVGKHLTHSPLCDIIRACGYNMVPIEYKKE
jgi:DNA polymerase I-like protein with 3'-5' exonuclease and polymerase domains